MISVIIPNYNHGSFLKQRIDSVINQSYTDFEIILLDDCSTDNSRDIIESYKDNTHVTTVIYNNVNSGSPFVQWNKGVDKARGEYVWIAESDDYAEPDFLIKMVNQLSKDDNIVLAYCDSFEINEKNEFLGRWSRWQNILSNNIWTTDFNMSGNILNATYNCILNVIPNASSVVFKKSAYISSPFITQIENLKFTGDWIMWFSIIQNSNVFYCHEPLNYFRYHSGTTRSNKRMRLSNVTEHYQAIYKLGKLTAKTLDSNAKALKFHELYASWNPSLLKLTNKENRGILKFALLTDLKILGRMFKSALKRLHVI